MSKHPAYDVAKNLAEANIPSNVQIEKTLDSTKQVLKEEMQKRGTGAPEYKLAKDTTTVLDTSKKFIEEKNKGELFQKFVQDANEAVRELEQQFRSQKFFLDRYQVYQATKQPIQDFSKIAQANADSLKSLALTLVNSSEFRSLVVEFIDLVQSMAQLEQQKTGGIPSMKPSTTEEIPLTEEARLKGQQAKEFGQQILTDIREGTIPIPEEKRQLILLRLRQLVQRLNGDPNFTSAVNGIFQLFDQIQYWAVQLKEQAMQTTQTIETSALWRMWIDGKSFVANFTGQQILNKSYDDVWNFYQLVMNDERLRTFFWEFREFFLTVLREPALLDTDDFKQKWNNLYTYSYEWMNDQRYQKLVNTIYNDFNIIIERLRSDTVSQQLSEDVTRLAKDVFLDESGNPSLQIMTQGLDNLRSLVAPILRKYLENVPIPPFSGSDETYDWQIDQMFINGSTIIPDNFELKVWGDANVSLTEKPSSAATYITMWIRDIGLVAKDIKFHFKRKSFPKLEESGVADVSISDKGTKLKIVWKVIGQQNQPWKFSIYQVACSLSNLDITIKQSSHTWLMKFLTTLFSGTIRRNIEDKIESSVIEGLATVNDRLNETVQTQLQKIY